MSLAFKPHQIGSRTADLKNEPQKGELLFQSSFGYCLEQGILNSFDCRIVG